MELEPRASVKRRMETPSKPIPEIALTRWRAWYITPKGGDARMDFERGLARATIGTIEIFATFS